MADNKEAKSSKGEQTGGGSRIWLGAAAAALVIVGIVVWAVTSGGDSDSGESASGGEAEIVSVDSLREAAADEETPIYWAGTQAGSDLELSQPDVNRTYVRYLTDGAEAGDPEPSFLTVGTYAQDGAAAALRRQGNEPGGVLGTAPGGGIVYFNRDQPRSVYLAYPGVDVQIEVYDPDFKRALQLVNSGQIVSVG